MTTPASPTEPERCPNCGLPTVRAGSAFYRALGIAHKAEFCARRGNPRCLRMHIARLRAELASVQALSEAERRVVKCAVEFFMAPDSDKATEDDLLDATNSLLALRKDPTDG